MKQVLLVFLGGGVGSMFRYLISRYLNPFFTQFFLGTFLVNIIGCLILGLLMGLYIKNGSRNGDQILLFLGTGFCGGFTTFSSFALEKYGFLSQGQVMNFLIYLIASIVAGIIAVFIGVSISKLL